MLGGGTFTSQNKILPGAYINFVSLNNASANLTDRGIATMPLELDWGIENEVFEVTNEDFQKNSMKIFGYPYDHEKLKGLRDLFKNIKTLYAYRLNSGGTAATNGYASANFSGVRGNDLKIVIQKNVDNDTLFDVKTVLGTTVVDVQSVKNSDELKNNDYVNFNGGLTLSETAGVPLANGTNGTVNVAAHQDYIDKIESYSFNTLGVVAKDDSINALYAIFCKRMREEVGAKFQVVLYNMPGDYEGIINVKNKTTDVGYSEASLVYWVTGVEAGCAINKSTLNTIYDGEFKVEVNYTQNQLEEAILNGEFTLHKVGTDVRVLEDINSLKTTTDTKGDIFKDNQTIRIIDQIANDMAVLFNTKYLGKIPNDESGRTSFHADVVKHHKELQNIRAIEDFKDSDVTVEKGADRKSIVVNDAVTPIGTMTKLYSTTVIR